MDNNSSNKLKGLYLLPVFAVLIFALSTFTTQDAYAPVPPIVLAWNQGWDQFSSTAMNYATSEVRYHQPPPANPIDLQIHYKLRGANPSDSYGVGIHLFWTSTSQCVGTFGQFSASNCDTATRQGNTRAFESFELGTVTTDANGAGNLFVNIMGISSGTDELEFNVRIPASNPASGGCPFCDVISQSPGPTYGASGSTVSITIL